MGVLVPDVFHVADAAEWAAAGPTYERSTLGVSLAEEGFIHLSFAWQVEDVFQRYCSGYGQPLVLLRVDSSALDLVIEPGVPGGEQFPHLYGPLPVTAVLDAQPFTGAFPY